ncbi:hypothetical protein SAMN05192561_10971 [Halopenitus malekzadehii]|uniref:Uncharacterized protein n=1 Tax=Halopenitus malekzadehii TaxID=1267564 RepID=A0A1H6JHJ9_9EURY|nr:hypothetical protein [Halopenitus malekzadehii]SEH58572.1 hypothetical protein SAMN05192561_10971 [Halopenitus malekzadehii]
MSEAMTNENSTDDESPADIVRTSVEVDRQIWRQVRAEAVGEGKNVSDKLEEILREYFGDDDDT